MLPIVRHRRPSRTIRAASAGFLILAAAPWAVAPAEASTALLQEETYSCDACHETSLEGSVHQDFGCSDCHSNIAGGPHQEAPLAELGGGEICSQCHDAASEVEQSVHGGVLECMACHGPPHEVKSPDDFASLVNPLKQIQTCGQCHDSKGLMDRYLRSVHGRALVISGLINAPSCSDCHGAHSILGPTEPTSTVSANNVPNTCGACHQYLLTTWRDKSSHGRAWKEGKSGGPVCTTCHSSHQVMEPTSSMQRLRSAESCGGCHGVRYTTYRDSFHGQVTDLGFLTAATCSDCHTPHQSLPLEDPESSINPANLGATCGKCHEGVNESFLTFDPHDDPQSSHGNSYVRFVWVFMTVLLIGVFGFFGLHDLLWLQRSLAGLWRGEAAAVKNHREGPYVRRFGKLEIRLHVVIIASFLLLAASGLPLKFHFTEWADQVAALLGGIDSARTLHRLAALVTFGYAAVHVFSVARRVLVHKDYGLLWGWRSMTPRGEDFSDLFKNVRYFLYLGERPKMSRWSYWEKFDYFAVFWGVVIIGVSGLMLWFPGFFTLFLPGWTLNAAFIIHSDEALLATCFIFIFHFFHTHLRPEVFPMDPVVFTGVMPLEQFKEERPREYRHLVERGELESLLVDPPSPERMRRARIFGFTALSVGTALLLGILGGFIFH